MPEKASSPMPEKASSPPPSQPAPQVSAADKERAELRARLAALDALDVLLSWVRDLWVVACGASEVLCNCDREAELLAAAVATPEHYARLLAVRKVRA